MRIIGGAWRGRRLTSLGNGDPNAHLRPTTDRVRESLFNQLAHGLGDPVTGAQVLDLFAGTGALGLEALSRGAASATFVENGRKSLDLLNANIAALGADAAVLARDVRRLGPGAPHTLVFLDPPYGTELGQTGLIASAQSGWIEDGALVVWEDDQPRKAPGGFTLGETRRYGGTHMTFLRYTGL